MEFKLPDVAFVSVSDMLIGSFCGKLRLDRAASNDSRVFDARELRCRARFDAANLTGLPSSVIVVRALETTQSTHRQKDRSVILCLT
jgi:hypothetical protein